MIETVKRARTERLSRPSRPDNAASSAPGLQNGDHLAQPEFHRRYEDTPEDFRAELIEGVVYVSSPVRVKHHGRPLAHVLGWLGHYCAATPGVDVATDSTVILDLDNEVQPDAFLRIEPEKGGRSTINDDGYLVGPPELVVEVAASSVSIDVHRKRRAYRRAGVQEYLVWRTADRAVDWWMLQEGEFVRLATDEAGVVCSTMFPGLCLDTRALVDGDLARVLATLQARLATDPPAEPHSPGTAPA